MDNAALESLARLCGSIIKEDWKKSLDALFTLLRKEFVFDNLAVYLLEQNNSVPEVAYARAAGRGRSHEADASWGEEIANQVVASRRIVVTNPSKQVSPDRIAMPCLLGLPIELSDRRGALVFVRFGGPKYTKAEMPLAALAAVQAARAFEQRFLQENLAQLEHARHRAQLQDDFIATISHELHTPLGFIKGYTTSLLRSDTTWDMATQREFLTIIDEESDHLMNLIGRMLDSARLQSGSMPMDFQPVRMDSLIRDVVMRVRGRQKDLDIALDLMPSPPIQADTVRLAQVFDNLFENAIKYAPACKITITLQVERDRQVVTFSDAGPGIPLEHLPFLFERFYRVPAHSGKHGAGLGLFICRQIIQAHRGEISVRTTPGKGTAFRIELPAPPKKASD